MVHPFETRSVLALAGTVACLAVAILGFGPPSLQIVQPHLGAPALVQPGDTVRVEVVFSRPFWRPELEARLDDADGGREPLEIRHLRHNLRGTRSTFEVALPADLPPGGLDLTVRAGAVGQTRPLAIHVVDEPGRRVKLVQIADLPLLAGYERGPVTIESVIDEINLLAPTAVLITGDLVYMGGADGYQHLISALRELEAPAIIAAGNHEYQYWDDYLKHFVRPWSAVDLGSLRFISLHSAHGRDQLSRSQLRWFRQVIAERPGSRAVIQMHHPVFGKRQAGCETDAIVREMIEHRSPLMLAGHLHYDMLFDAQGRAHEDTWEFPGPKFAVTTTAGDDHRLGPSGEELSYSGYRLIRLVDGELESFTYDLDGDGVRDAASSYPFGKLSAEFPQIGSAVIHNGLNEPVEGARVRLAVPGGARTLRPDVGRIAEIRSRGDATVYVVEIDLPGGSTTPIHLLEPTSS